MALLTWSSKYSVGVQSLDAQHTTLFNILNELHDAMMKGQTQSVVGNLLSKLVSYTRSHFVAEEALMAAAKYPGLAMHRIKHHDLTKQVEDFAEKYKKGESTVNIQLMNFLRDWLTTHIEKEDKEYGPWLNKGLAR